MKKNFLRLSVSLLLLTLTGCSLWGSNAPTPAQTLEQNIKNEQSLKRDAFLELKLVSSSAEEVTTQVILHNPSRQKIASIRSWVSYPTALLKGAKVDFSTPNPFGLIAPGENGFDEEHGLTKIGVSIDPQAAPEEALPIATLKFERLRNEVAALAFFDQREQGHTQVLVEHAGALRSILGTTSTEPLVLGKFE